MKTVADHGPYWAYQSCSAGNHLYKILNIVYICQTNNYYDLL